MQVPWHLTHQDAVLYIFLQSQSPPVHLQTTFEGRKAGPWQVLPLVFPLTLLAV